MFVFINYDELEIVRSKDSDFTRSLDDIISNSGYVLKGWWREFMGLRVLDYLENEEHSEYSSTENCNEIPKKKEITQKQKCSKYSEKD